MRRPAYLRLTFCREQCRAQPWFSWPRSKCRGASGAAGSLVWTLGFLDCRKERRAALGMWILFATLMGGDDSPVDEADVQAWVRAARVGNRSAARAGCTRVTSRICSAPSARWSTAMRPRKTWFRTPSSMPWRAFIALFAAARDALHPEWLLTLALNRARKAAPRRAERQPNPRRPRTWPSFVWSRRPLLPQEALAVRRELLDALATLPDPDRQVVFPALRRFELLRREEVADVSRSCPRPTFERSASGSESTCWNGCNLRRCLHESPLRAGGSRARLGFLDLGAARGSLARTAGEEGARGARRASAVIGARVAGALLGARQGHRQRRMAAWPRPAGCSR